MIWGSVGKPDFERGFGIVFSLRRQAKMTDGLDEKIPFVNTICLLWPLST
jgi:hypothetical protein